MPISLPNPSGSKPASCPRRTTVVSVVSRLLLCPAILARSEPTPHESGGCWGATHIGWPLKITGLEGT
jgi:hypothetical protein